MIDEFHAVLSDVRGVNPYAWMQKCKGVDCVTATIGEKGEERVQDQFGDQKVDFI